MAIYTHDLARANHWTKINKSLQNRNSFTKISHVFFKKYYIILCCWSITCTWLELTFHPIVGHMIIIGKFNWLVRLKPKHSTYIVKQKRTKQLVQWTFPLFISFMAIVITRRHVTNFHGLFTCVSTSFKFRCWIFPLPKKWLIFMIFNVAGIFTFHFSLFSQHWKLFPRFYVHGANETIGSKKPHLSKLSFDISESIHSQE